ncbi:hypothetical protein BH10PLA2_BH10PLA2_00610 [soil metagenome]
MTTQKIAFASSTALTITLNSLANSATAGRQATVIDNGTNLYIDALVTCIVSTSASALASPNLISIYVSGSEDGTNYDQDTAVMGASDAAYTIDTNTNLRLAALINCSTSSKVYNKIFSIAQLYGGAMPRKWTVVVVNNTGQSLLGSGNSMSYSGIAYTNA